MGMFSASVASPSPSSSPSLAAVRCVFVAIVVALVVAFTVVVSGNEDFHFTNLQCDSLDPAFAEFGCCQLKLLRRGVVGLNLLVKLHKVPVTNVSVNLSLLKKVNGFRPFMYNVTTDFCAFMLNQKRHPFLGIFLGAFTKHSNINHSCPYNHDLVISNLVLNENQMRYLPLPPSEYMFRLKVAAYNDWKADVRVQFAVRES